MTATRNTYRSTLQLLKKLSEIPQGQETLVTIVRELRDTYPKRKALLEEIQNMFP